MSPVPNKHDHPHMHGSARVDDVEILAAQDGYLGQRSCRYLLRYGERCFVVAVVGLFEDPHGIESTWWADASEVFVGQASSPDQQLIQAGLSAESRQTVLAGAMELIRQLGSPAEVEAGNNVTGQHRGTPSELLRTTRPLLLEHDPS